MKLICSAQQLHGAYGTVTEGQEFECDDDAARHLIHSGMARQPASHQVLYETKVITPSASEVGPRPPFRDLPLSDKEPAGVAPEGDSLLPVADVPSAGTADTGGRGKRQRSNSAG